MFKLNFSTEQKISGTVRFTIFVWHGHARNQYITTRLLIFKICVVIVVYSTKYLHSTSPTLDGPSSLSQVPEAYYFLYYYLFLSWPGPHSFSTVHSDISIWVLLTIYSYINITSPHQHRLTSHTCHLVHVVFRTYTTIYLNFLFVIE